MTDAPEAILIVEDDENDAMFISIALRRNKVTSHIMIVRDGLEALHYLKGEPPYEDRNANPMPSVIYTDIKMPRMDGFALLTWLKAHPECSIIPTIIMTSSAEDRDVRQAYTLGVNSYIVKPNSVEELTRVLGITLEYWKVCVKPAKIKEKCSQLPQV